MKIKLDKSDLYRSAEAYDKDLTKVRMAQDCEFENITNFGLVLTVTGRNGTDRVTNIKFDNRRVTNAMLAVDETIKSEVYDALTDISDNERDSLTVCSVYDMESAGSVYNFMKSVEQGESELTTPWLIVLDMNPVYLPSVRTILTMSHDVGVHTLILLNKNIGSRAGLSVLHDPFCVQHYCDLVSMVDT